MMGIELGSIACTGDKASTWVSGRLADVGFRVYRSFDLRSASGVDSRCACPHHGTEACDCQMVVLLVYAGQRAPATVVLHGHLGKTWMVLAEAPDAALQTTIVEALAPGTTPAASVM